MAKAGWISAMPLFQGALRSRAKLTILENSRLWQNDRAVSSINSYFFGDWPLR
jgi:hypothetical protein